MILNNKVINVSSNSIELNQDGENIIEVVWGDKLSSLESMFSSCSSLVSLNYQTL